MNIKVSNLFSLSKLPLLLLAFHLVSVEGACPPRLTAASVNPDIATNPACPGDQGKAIVADDGTHLLLQCCTHENANANHITQIKGTKSRADCANKCLSDKYPTCDSAKYYSKSGDCDLYTSGGFSSTGCGADDHDWLSFIDPPAQPAFNNVTHLCSTECPGAHGQKYVSDYGELFHMECGKRHGTMPFKEEEALTYRDCIDGCSKVPKCSSVDWSSRSKMCYYLTHSGTAPIMAPGFDSAYSFGCAGACDKDKDECGCGGKGKGKDAASTK